MKPMFYRVRIIRDIEVGRGDTMMEALRIALHPDDHDYPEKLTVEVTEIHREQHGT